MKKQNLITAAAAVATAAALGLGGAALAQAGQSTPAVVQADASPTANPGNSNGNGNSNRMRPPGQPKEKLKEFVTEHGITGETAVKVTQAAVTKEPTAYLLRVVVDVAALGHHLDEVDGPLLHGRNGGLHGAEAREDDDGQSGVGRHGRVEHGQSVGDELMRTGVR